ncbi:MAG TPA: hypothetical protein VFV19_13770 [Candidatus Polarisedimenticolaceae bacterium]|nr:hypothetical protein [Candidatus Polarisedimenticolaceae bacterium]
MTDFELVSLLVPLKLIAVPEHERASGLLPSEKNRIADELGEFGLPYSALDRLSLGMKRPTGEIEIAHPVERRAGSKDHVTSISPTDCYASRSRMTNRNRVIRSTVTVEVAAQVERIHVGVDLEIVAKSCKTTRDLR